MEQFVQSVVKREISTFLVYIIVIGMIYYGTTKLIEKYENDNKVHQNAHWNLVNHLNHLGGIVRENSRDIEYLNDEMEERDDESSVSSASSVSTEEEAVKVE